MPFILGGVTLKAMSVVKLFCDHSNSIWDHVNIIPSAPLNNIIKGPETAVTRNFSYSIQTAIGCRHCLALYCFTDQVVTLCISFSRKGAWFFFPLIENGAAIYFAHLNKGLKTWCTSATSTSTRVFKRCCYSYEQCTQIMHHCGNGCFLLQQAPKKLRKCYKNNGNFESSVLRSY